MPKRVASFSVKKQGEADNACGLYCVLSAASHLSWDDYPVHEAAVFDHLRRSPGDAASMFDAGLAPLALRRLARAANLKMYRPKRIKFDLLESKTSDAIWVASVRLLFELSSARAGDALVPETSNQGHNHYILVLDVVNDLIRVADPHPWHDDLYTLSRTAFERAWTFARPHGGALWAACLSV